MTTRLKAAIDSNTFGRTMIRLISLLGAAALSVGIAEARITRIEITSVESPTFDGRAFGRV